ncbi:MAG: hypothetical protein LBL04_00655 [Bacteroidales bacterium]|jgi:hypothetical protein|nr:hypothetical protein [Bacteroidales bacterium]
MENKHDQAIPQETLAEAMQLIDQAYERRRCRLQGVLSRVQQLDRASKEKESKINLYNQLHQ